MGEKEYHLTTLFNIFNDCRSSMDRFYIAEREPRSQKSFDKARRRKWVRLARRRELIKSSAERILEAVGCVLRLICLKNHIMYKCGGCR